MNERTLEEIVRRVNAGVEKHGVRPTILRTSASHKERKPAWQELLNGDVGDGAALKRDCREERWPLGQTGCSERQVDRRLTGNFDESSSSEEHVHEKRKEASSPLFGMSTIQVIEFDCREREIETTHLIFSTI